MNLLVVRGNARVSTIDSSSGTVMGGKFQAGNATVGTDLSVVRGVVCGSCKQDTFRFNHMDICKGC